RDKGRRAEAVVPDLDDMAQFPSVDLARQQFQEFAEIRFVELLRRRKLPQYRAEPVAELEHTRVVEMLDGIAGLRQHAAIGGEARALQREYKTVRHLARPFAEALRLLRAVIGAVDLDRGQLRGGIGQLLRLRKLLRIKHAAPGRERPAADAEIDVT